MRQILLGPFGSMGIMSMKMRNICLEDVFVESFLLMTAIFRLVFADTDYEFVGALGSLIASSCISITTGILVFDEGVQCWCFRNKAICTWCCCFWKRGVEIVSDKALLRIFNIVSLLGICGALITIITEAITFFDMKEVFNPVVHVPGVPAADKYIERDHAIIVICIQCIVTLPWRIYTYKVSKGVLAAIHCVEVLQFQAHYKADALRNLLPDTGLMHNVDLAHECDIPTIAKIYCDSFADLFEDIGLPRDAGPKVIEAHWRSRGDVALARWLGRVGVVRDETGKVVAALSLQLPGDVAEYEQLAFCYKHHYEPVLLNPTSPLPKVSRTASGRTVSNTPSPKKYCCLSPEFYSLGLLNSYRFKYKHAIISEHVCIPGEAYIDFLCVDQAERREGSGRRLVKWAEQSAEKLGCGRIAASVWGEHKVTRAFYSNLGFKQTDQKVDIVSYILLQLIFCFKNRFFDWEKSLGQEKGLAITSNKYGFTSDRVSESDDFASMNASMHAGAMELLAAGKNAVANTFVTSRRQTASSSQQANGGDNAPKEKERRTKYKASDKKKTTKMNVLEMIIPNKMSSFHSSQIPDNSSHSVDLDTSSKGLLGDYKPSEKEERAPSAFDSLNILSKYSFGLNLKSLSNDEYTTVPDSKSELEGNSLELVDSDSRRIGLSTELCDKYTSLNNGSLKHEGTSAPTVQEAGSVILNSKLSGLKKDNDNV